MKRVLNVVAATAALLLCLAAVGRAAPVAPEDLFKMKFLSGAEISPDGTHVLVTESTLNGPKNRYDRSIALIDVQTGRFSPKVTGGTGDIDYDWMPDGHSFVFMRSLDNQPPELYRYSLETGKTTKLTDIAYAVSSPVVSHDGRHIALEVNMPDAVENAHIDFKKAGFEPTEQQSKTDIRTIDRLFFETNGLGYTYRDHEHIWIVDADGSNAKQVTFGTWNEAFAAWSPDDRTILFNSLRYASTDAGPMNVYAVSAEGGVPHEFAAAEPDNNALFYGAGGSKAYYFASDVKDAAELPALIEANTDGSGARTVVPKDTVSWGDSLLADMKEGGGFCDAPLPSGSLAILNVDGPGYANIRTLDLRSGALSDLTPPAGEAWSCTVSRDGRTLAYLYSDFLHPADVHVLQIGSGASPRRLTNVNSSYLALATLSTPQAFTVKDSAGLTVQAWFMPATGGPSAQKHPTLLDIHGGPELQFGDTFFQEFQYYASLGYNVVFADPTGSSGHGYAFEEAVENNYGEAMFADVQAVMDAVSQRPDVDASRLGVLGGSYGGYATLWVIAHTNRYKVAVAERAVSNLISEGLASDFAGKNVLDAYYTWGPPWSPASTKYATFSPLTYVANVRTPLLILHSTLDTRTPVDQSLQEFTALKILGATVEYVEVPNETHNLSRNGSPIHRVERLHVIADWLGRYLLH